MILKHLKAKDPQFEVHSAMDPHLMVVLSLGPHFILQKQSKFNSVCTNGTIGPQRVHFAVNSLHLRGKEVRLFELSVIRSSHFRFMSANLFIKNMLGININLQNIKSQSAF